MKDIFSFSKSIFSLIDGFDISSLFSSLHYWFQPHQFTLIVLLTPSIPKTSPFSTLGYILIYFQKWLLCDEHGVLIWVTGDIFHFITVPRDYITIYISSYPETMFFLISAPAPPPVSHPSLTIHIDIPPIPLFHLRLGTNNKHPNFLHFSVFNKISQQNSRTDPCPQ